MKLNIKARLVAAIAQFKADHDIRYYLNGVYVEPIKGGGALIVATNGHAMGVWRDTTAEVERPAILRIGKRLEAACAGSDLKRLVITDDRLAVLIVQPATATEVYIQQKDEFKDKPWEVPGAYPNWRKVIPANATKNMANTLNAAYIAMARRALQIGAGEKFTGIALMQGEKDKGIAVIAKEAPDFFGVIMPMLGETTVYPDWVAALNPPAVDAPAPQPSDATPPYDAIADGVAVQVDAEPPTDPMYEKAVDVVRKHDKASISLVQRVLQIGYNHAARLLEDMEKRGVVTFQNVDGIRVVLPAPVEGGAA